MDAHSIKESNAPVYEKERIAQDCLIASHLSLQRLETARAPQSNKDCFAKYGKWYIRPNLFSTGPGIFDQNKCNLTCDCSKCKTLAENSVSPLKRQISLEEISANEKRDFWCTLKGKLNAPSNKKPIPEPQNFWSTLKGRLNSRQQSP